MHDIFPISLRGTEALSTPVNPLDRLLSCITVYLEDIIVHEIGPATLNDTGGRRTPDVPESVRGSEDVVDISIASPRPPPYTVTESVC